MYRVADYLVRGRLKGEPWDIILATHNTDSVLKENIINLLFIEKIDTCTGWTPPGFTR